VKTSREIYIISDIHLGGEYPKPGDLNQRGFRICTHADAVARFINGLAEPLPGRGPIELVLNGDTVDFLAERAPNSSSWDPAVAVDKLNAIVRRDLPVFEALGRFLEKGHRLVLLLGNHDIELCLPSVRRALYDAIGIKGSHDFEFIYDGEAYRVGDLLIEHGNRYDMFNIVDFDALRRCRSLLSRLQEIPGRYKFEAPAGSYMVSSVINPIKGDYSFVDLLKPEQEAVVPLLLALEPGFRKYIASAAKLAYKARRHRLESATLPSWGGDIASEGDQMSEFGGDMVATQGPASDEITDQKALDLVLQRTLGDQAGLFLVDARANSAPYEEMDPIGADISAGDYVDRALGLASLLFSKKSGAIEKRLPDLLKALRGLQLKNAFSTDSEPLIEYNNAARELCTHGIGYVAFGHTHLPKNVVLEGGGHYLNSGAWADVLKFPEEIISGSDQQALDQLRTFVQSMRDGDFSHWTLFNPTYLRVETDNSETVKKAELCVYREPGAA
jgi:UDP-2,3-diacylglucosamine pyrophosphatase LpxH